MHFVLYLIACVLCTVDNPSAHALAQAPALPSNPSPQSLPSVPLHADVILQPKVKDDEQVTATKPNVDVADYAAAANPRLPRVMSLPDASALMMPESGSRSQRVSVTSPPVSDGQYRAVLISGRRPSVATVVTMATTPSIDTDSTGETTQPSDPVPTPSSDNIKWNNHSVAVNSVKIDTASSSAAHSAPNKTVTSSSKDERNNVLPVSLVSPVSPVSPVPSVPSVSAKVSHNDVIQKSLLRTKTATLDTNKPVFRYVSSSLLAEPELGRGNRHSVTGSNTLPVKTTNVTDDRSRPVSVTESASRVSVTEKHSTPNTRPLAQNNCKFIDIPFKAQFQ